MTQLGQRPLAGPLPPITELRRVALPAVLPINHSYVVYFICNGNRVKIGITKVLTTRLTQFGLTRHQVALLLEGYYELEDSLHAHFGELRVDGTEWFRLAPPLFAFIRQCTMQPAVAVLGGPEHQAQWEDLDQIAARTGLPLATLRSWSRQRTWPHSSRTTGGRRRLYYRSQVDRWLAHYAAAA